MDKAHYKAYLSYSHRDERWAGWLHRALERYRVPARLRAEHGGDLPARLAPIFRDREDLSSAQDLSAHLQTALEQSAALIVLCSPAAAASRWVGEEIRTFRELHPERPVLCLIVDGDPQAAPADGGCFPPALREGQPQGYEPLAADARPYADGKRLARQKLIAGLLGVRLDQLRQRDLVRRRRWQLGGAALATLLVFLLAGAWSAHQAEQQQRAQAEEMVGFLVNLGSDLESNIDLDSLARISAAAQSYLQALDPGELTPATSRQLGLVLRQLGNTNLYQGSPEAALAAYEESLAIFERLYADNPRDSDAAFELAQAEFYVGNYYYEMGVVSETLEHFGHYLDIAASRHQLDPEDPLWLLEYSYASSNLNNFRIDRWALLGEAELAAKHADVALARRALAADKGSAEALSHVGNELAYLADAQAQLCRLPAAEASRLEALQIAQQLAEADPADNYLAEDVAYRQSGLAALLFEQGQHTAALEMRQAAEQGLLQALAKNPSNRRLQSELARNQHHSVLSQRALTPGSEEAAKLAAAQATLERLVLEEQGTADNRRDLYDLFLTRAGLELDQGDLPAARASLQRFTELRDQLQEEAGELPAKIAQGFTIRWRYLWWRIEGVDPAQFAPALLREVPISNDSYSSCHEADMIARHAFLVGDQTLLQTQLAYLRERSYGHPDFIAFCTREGLCPA
ncbi:MAG: toll/interleukin-1 receptor domain-containing protein [Xanthomonadales bacterium]|nr:toll/interleukin-1 receptor domain-containing protein [Xanthomonadales bacterium]